MIMLKCVFSKNNIYNKTPVISVIEKVSTSGLIRLKIHLGILINNKIILSSFTSCPRNRSKILS